MAWYLSCGSLNGLEIQIIVDQTCTQDMQINKLLLGCVVVVSILLYDTFLVNLPVDLKSLHLLVKWLNNGLQVDLKSLQM